MEEQEQQAVRKTYKYKLKPTPEQEQAMALVLRRCRELYNAALQERKEAWEKCRASVTIAGQSAQLPGIKDVRPEYRDIHSQVLQDVLTRLDHAFQAFFRRLREGQTPGYPRFQGSNRYDSFTYKQFGNGATLDNGFLVLSKIGRIAVRWSRPSEGTIKTVTISREADGWYACISCAEVPTQPLPVTGQRTRINQGDARPQLPETGHTFGHHASHHLVYVSPNPSHHADGHIQAEARFRQRVRPEEARRHEGNSGDRRRAPDFS